MGSPSKSWWLPFDWLWVPRNCLCFWIPFELPLGPWRIHLDSLWATPIRCRHPLDSLTVTMKALQAPFGPPSNDHQKQPKTVRFLLDSLKVCGPHAHLYLLLSNKIIMKLFFYFGPFRLFVDFSIGALHLINVFPSCVELQVLCGSWNLLIN